MSVLRRKEEFHAMPFHRWLAVVLSATLGFLAAPLQAAEHGGTEHGGTSVVQTATKPAVKPKPAKKSAKKPARKPSSSKVSKPAKKGKSSDRTPPGPIVQ